MQFNGEPSGTFREDARWNAEDMAVEFHLDVRLTQHGDKTEHAFLCRVGRAALDDAARRRGPLKWAEALCIFERFKQRIYAVVDRKLKAGEFGDERVIYVDTHDLNRQ